MNQCMRKPPQFFYYRLTNILGDEVAVEVPYSINKILVAGELAMPVIQVFYQALKKYVLFKLFKNLVVKCLEKAGLTN